VHSNQPYTDVTATGGGYSWSYETGRSGYAVIYLNGPPCRHTDHGYGRRSYLHRHMDLGPHDSRVTVPRASDVERFVERLTT
jgi:hypothetical protein